MKKELIWAGGVVAVIGIIVLIAKRNKSLYKDAGDKAMDSAVSKKTGNAVSTLHPKVKPKVEALLNASKNAGLPLLATSGMRDCAEQTKLYAKGRTAPGSVVTNAKCGESSHNFGTAVDVVPLENGKPNWNSKNWDKIGAIGKKVGLQWGGDWKSFKDKPHFEDNFGLSLKQMQNLVAQKKTNNGFVIV